MEKANPKPQKLSATVLSTLGHGLGVLWLIASVVIISAVVIVVYELPTSGWPLYAGFVGLPFVAGGTLLSMGIVLIATSLIMLEETEDGPLSEGDFLRKGENGSPLLKLDLLYLAKGVRKMKKRGFLLYECWLWLGLGLVTPGLILWDMIRGVIVDDDYAPAENRRALLKKLGYIGLWVGYICTVAFWSVFLNMSKL